MYVVHIVLRVLTDPELDVIAGLAALMLWVSRTL